MDSVIQSKQLLNKDVLSVVLTFMDTTGVARFATSRETNSVTKDELERRTIRFKANQVLGYTFLCSCNTYGPVRIVRRTNKSIWFTDGMTRWRPGPHRRTLNLSKRRVRVGGSSVVDGRMERFCIDGGRTLVYPDCEWDESKPHGGFAVWNE